MEKNFSDWHVLKERVHSYPSTPVGYKEREVWWVCLGHNVGFEEDGKGQEFNRPVLVVKGFNRNLFWGVPLSTTSKIGTYYHPFVMNGTTSTALLSQMRVLDTKRLLNKTGMMGQKEFAQLKLKLISFLS